MAAVAGSDGHVFTKPSGAIVEPPNDGDDILVAQLWWLRHSHGFTMTEDGSAGHPDSQQLQAQGSWTERALLLGCVSLANLRSPLVASTVAGCVVIAHA